LFTGAGWEIRPGKYSCASDSAIKGKQELYLYPMSFSGVILREEVPAIQALLTQAKTFRLRHIGYFEVYQDMDDETYLSHLESRCEEIIDAILNYYKTKRRDLFIPGVRAEEIGESFRIRRLSTKNTSDDLAYQMIAELVGELVDSGRLIAANTRSGVFFRTAVGADRSAETC